ncbi:hypothetical protein I4U23_029923 [Adineta vaga]|nr:hypothetical protein I4U23_029923 [Adineta vaga]
MSNDELELMRERYLKLVDIHGQLQIQNSLLEERLLSIVETYSDEKKHLEQSLCDAKQQIVYLQETINELQIDKQRYKDDCNLAVRLLHQHPQEFISTTSTGQMQEQLKNRFETTSINQPISSQRTMMLPTFPPTFVPLLPPTSSSSTTSSSINTQTTVPSMAATDDNLRLAANALFKSNSVHHFPSTQFICSACNRTIKRCDASIQTSLDGKPNPNEVSRLRLVSLSTSDDGAWLSLDSPHAHGAIQETPVTNTKQTFQHGNFDHVSIRPIPKMHHV